MAHTNWLEPFCYYAGRYVRHDKQMFQELPLLLLSGDRKSHYEVTAFRDLLMLTQTGGRSIAIVPNHPQPLVNTKLQPLYSGERRGTHRTGVGVARNLRP